MILDQHLFLEGPRVEAERGARQRAAFLATRRPARPSWRAAPTPRAPEPLAAALTGYFDRPGARGRSVRRATYLMRGLVAPAHRLQPGRPAGTRGPIAPLPRPATPDMFHRSGNRPRGLDGHQFAATAKAFETPFGPLEVDREVLDAIVRAGPVDLFARRARPPSEHSIEFQAVRLQYLRHRRAGGERRIVPLLASFAHECLARDRTPAGHPEIEAVLDAVRDAMGTSRAATAIVAGADLAHVGPRFGDDWPAGPTELARVQSEDRGLLDPVSAGDAEGFFARRSGKRDRNRICGLSPIYARCDSCPERRGRFSTTSSGPTPRARSHSPAWPSRKRGRVDDRACFGRCRRPRIRASPAPSGIDREGTWRHEGVEVTHPWRPPESVREPSRRRERPLPPGGAVPGPRGGG
jgi:AmmeMemoRadiSam system protein B